MQAVKSGPVRHQVSVTTLDEYAQGRLGLAWPLKLEINDWLSLPQQRLAMVKQGGIYRDGLGQLEKLRRELDWYPHELWLHLMACQWEQIAQEEPFVSRCGQAGDELGSRVLAARLVRQVMQLCFLIEKRYRPYSKWMGSAFALLGCAADMKTHFEGALASGAWEERESQLSGAYTQLARMHNALGLTEALSDKATPFHSRPYLVIHGGRFAQALRSKIKSPEIQALPRGLGSIDQMTDNVDILENVALCRAMVSASH
jgi:hypothetical protein